MYIYKSIHSVHCRERKERSRSRDRDRKDKDRKKDKDKVRGGDVAGVVMWVWFRIGRGGTVGNTIGIERRKRKVIKK